MKKLFYVKGMHCASCASNIKKQLSKMEGVESCEVNFATENAEVKFDPDKTSIDKMNENISQMGYSLIGEEGHKHEPNDEHDHGLMNKISKEEKQKELAMMKKNLWILMPAVVLSFAYMGWEVVVDVYGIMTDMMIMRFFDYLFLVLASYIIFVIGKQYMNGIKVFLKTGRANMDTLVGIGTSVAYVYSFVVLVFGEELGLGMHYFDVPIVVIGFTYLGKYIEVKSKIRAGNAIEKLLGLQAKTAIVERNGKEIEIALEDVKTGDIVIVKPGSKIALDGVIVDGESSVDESMISGESMPIDKKINDKVIGGTMNINGFLKIKTHAVGKNTVLSNIIRMVQEAQSSKAEIQNVADKITEYFVPGVLVIAFISFVSRYVLGNPMMAMLSLVTVLIIACPCALGLATPMGIVAGVGKGAELGILIKNAESLQKLKSVDTIVFDKTGTVTEGKPEVIDFVKFYDEEESKLINMMYSLEKMSEHPLASAITKRAKHSGAKEIKIQGFESIKGKGVKGSYAGDEVIIGTSRLMQENDVKISEDIEKTSQKLQNEAKTVIYVAVGNEVVALLSIADKLKENAKYAIKQLHDMGIRSIMISGDQKNVAEYIAGELGIDEVLAQAMPEDKARKIQELQKGGGYVAMCGDGINDAPALAQADVSIAMSTGADVAIDTADITLLAGDIEKISKAISLSKRTILTIKQNLFWAFVYNIVGIPLAAGIFYPIVLNPVFAGAAMAFSSVSVVLNSMRLKRFN